MDSNDDMANYVAAYVDDDMATSLATRFAQPIKILAHHSHLIYFNP